MPKKNSSIFQDVNSIAQVALRWNLRWKMKSAQNFDINRQTYSTGHL